MKNDHICTMDFIPAYLDSGAEKNGISIEEWEKDQVICTYCEDQAGEPMCPGTAWKLTKK